MSCNFNRPMLSLPDYPHGIDDMIGMVHTHAPLPSFSEDVMAKLKQFSDAAAADLAESMKDPLPNEDVDEEKLDRDFEMPPQQSMKRELCCMTCKKVLEVASMMMLVWPGGPRDDRRASEASYGGRLNGTCKSCSGMGHDEFVKFSKMSWRKYTGAHKRKSESRVVTIRNLRRLLMDEFPQLRYHEVNDMSARRLAELCVSFAAAILNDQGLRQYSADAYMKYKASVVRGAHDLSEAGKQADEDSWVLNKFTCGASSDYLTQLTNCVLVSYLCRHCLYYGCNAMWVAHKKRFWFRCPRCLEQYRCGTDSVDLHDGRRVLAMYNPLLKVWSSFPASFGDSDAAAWIRNQAAAFCKSRMDPTSMGAAGTAAGCASSLGRLSVALQKMGQPQLFSRQPFNSRAAVDRGLEVNWRWDHCLEGTWGSVLSDQEARVAVFTEWGLLIELVGQVLVSGVSVASRL